MTQKYTKKLLSIEKILHMLYTTTPNIATPSLLPYPCHHGGGAKSHNAINLITKHQGRGFCPF